MKKFNLLVLISLLSISSMAQNNSKINEIFSNYTNSNPGAVVGIVKDGKLIFEQSYGLSDLENTVRTSASTNFRLASVSKQFTAAAIMQLINKGKLKFNTSLKSCFPELPAYTSAITIQQLLNHTSGILDYDEFIDESDNFKQISDQGVLELTGTFDKTYFEPGTKYQYSNTAYVLLGLIIEKYSGKSFPLYLSDHIFKPLNMINSVAYIKDVNDIKNRAYGYSMINDEWVKKDQSSTSATLGDGGIYSNLNDLVLWNNALYNESVLPKKYWDLAFNFQKLNSGEKINYGLGWHLKTIEQNKLVVYHTGSTTSFRNIFFRIPNENLGIIILTNRNTPIENNMFDLALKVYQVYSK